MRPVSHPGTHHYSTKPQDENQESRAESQDVRFVLVPGSNLGSYSERKLFTGFASAALIAWKLIVIKVITRAIKPAMKNTPGPMLI
jgi:hypothetical protein